MSDMFFEELKDQLRCPECHNSGLILDPEMQKVQCPQCHCAFPLHNDRPVLIRQGHALFPPAAYSSSSLNAHKSWKRWLKKFIPGTSVNLSRTRCLNRLQAESADFPEIRLLVIGAGRQRFELEERLASSPNIRIVCCDVDAAAWVDLYCDAHDLPFVDDSFDAVVTTAVLEHVLDPERVAWEIHRILKLGGLLYSELPFMQQVHEGAFDFTRFTLSGHRRLFRGFEELEKGLVAGPGTVLVWALENLALSLFPFRKLRLAVRSAVRCAFFWLKYVDYLVQNRSEALDGASCTYFLGRKVNEEVSEAEIIAGYVGGQHVTHV